MGLSYVADAPIPSRAANCVQVLQVSSALAQAGCDTTLFAPWSRDRIAGSAGAQRLYDEFALETPVTIRYLPHLRIRNRLRGSYFPVAALAARLSSRRLLMTRNPRIAALAADLGLGVILESHTPPNSGAVRAALERLICSGRLLLWIFISERLRQIMHGYVRKDTPTVVLHDAVDLQRFTPALSVAAARAKLGLEPRGKVILHAGNLYSGRGGEELIRAMPRLPQPSELWFVGGRPQDVERVERGVPPELRPRLRFFGHRSLRELATFLFAADVLVLAATSRGTAVDGTNHVDYSSPMKLFEYFAASRPIVATALAGVCEVVQDGKNGLVVALDDEGALIEGVRRALTDSELACRLADGARRTAEQRTWLNRAQEILRRVG